MLEFDALKSLNNNKDIVILKADNGGVVVILDKEDYQRKMLQHLCNNESYKKLNKNPLNKISKKVTLAIKSSSTISSLCHKLIESNPFTRKIHKEGAPLRPLVNTIGGPTYLLEKYLAQKLIKFHMY